MASLTRRTLMASAGALAASAARPARAAGQTITVWWTQGFYQAEDQAVKDSIAAWEKSSGNKVELTFLPVADVVEIPMSPDDAAKLIMSAGLIQPETQLALGALAERAKAQKVLTTENA